MRQTSRFRRRATRGIADTSSASAVEFALVAPVFLFLIFATLEVGFVMYLRSAVEAATQNAARMAITGDTYGNKGDREALIKQYLENKLSNILFSSTKYTIQTEVYDSIANLGGAGLSQAGMSPMAGATTS
ncbi:MAG: TadE/TadG family type IV pilus assembly protein [Hyphomicrobiales bacterium]